MGCKAALALARTCCSLLATSTSRYGCKHFVPGADESLQSDRLAHQPQDIFIKAGPAQWLTLLCHQLQVVEQQKREFQAGLA